jgi:outer membrane lipoprotein-sorting protein
MHSKNRFLALAAAAAIVALTAQTASSRLHAADLTVDQIVAKNLEARGGRSKMLAVKSALVTGKIRSGQYEAPFVLKWARPDKVRLDVTLPGGATVSQAYDGETAWGVNPVMGKTVPEKLTGDELESTRELAAAVDGPLLDYAAKGNRLESLGKATVDGTEYYKLKLTRPNGAVSTLFLDTEAFLHMRTEEKRKTPQGEMEYVATMSDYSEVGGLLFAMTREAKLKGAPSGQVFAIEKIDLDAAVDDADFKMPPAAPAPAKP